jgi:hypothetical protein
LEVEEPDGFEVEGSEVDGLELDGLELDGLDVDGLEEAGVASFLVMVFCLEKIEVGFEKRQSAISTKAESLVPPTNLWQVQ